MTQNTPKISVIIATHNRAALLPYAVESILQQSLKDIEIIIVDDASNDGTSEVIDQMKLADPRIRSLHLSTNHGPGAARNRGIALAEGEYIAIMDDDDISLPQRLEIESRLLDQNPEAGLVFSAVVWVDEDLQPFQEFPGVVLRGEFPLDSKDVFRLLYLESNKIPNPTIMARQTVLKHFEYPEDIWIGEDWLLFLKFAGKGFRMLAVPDPLVLMRRADTHSSLMSNKQEAFSIQRRIIIEVKQWLRQEGIRRFDNLHAHAVSNQIVREARFWGGVRGLKLCIQAIFVHPNNRFAWETFHWLLGKARKKGLDFVSLSAGFFD